jgi:hypothetical protein
VSTFDSNILLFKVKIADVITKQLMRIGEIEVEHDAYTDAQFLASCLADKWDQQYLDEKKSIEDDAEVLSKQKYPRWNADINDDLVEATMKLMQRAGMLPTRAELQVAAGKNVSEGKSEKPGYSPIMPAL